MLIAKEHHEKGLSEAEEEPEISPDMVPAYASALTPDGNGNGWKRA
jgi:hypothetical protein